MPSILDWVVPPEGADAEQQRDWQWRVAMAIIGMYGAGLAGSMAAIGLIAGISGFASQQSVTQMQQVVTEIRLEQIRDRIDQTRVRQCQAIMERNVIAMKELFGQMQSYINQHYVLAGYQYRVPDCGELVPYTAGLTAPTPAPTVTPHQ